ncbi:hypothetical protein [Flagellimonas flava]|uniref:hypothetical protein n=1 Tax=Flagellimonas flava TaxID=570519 RepID=UPI003D65D95C
MKALIIIFIALTATIKSPSAQEIIIEATYVGSEEGIYMFVDDDELEYEFSDIDVRAAERYDLDSDEYVGKKFKIGYETDTEIDENDEEYRVYYIVDLELIN